MIGWRDGQGEVHRGSLFATFAALARGDAWSFPALRAHQREPWHAFTVQVAALALIRGGGAMPQDEAGWRDLLLALTPGQPEAWELVVDDWSKPALLQPPLVAAGNRSDYKSRLPTPDALDMLVTAKNHDVKQERIGEAGEEDWLFALVTLQTTEGFMGAGNYGISRMNGGFASRMSLGIRPSGGGAAGAFARDVHRLVDQPRSHPERRSGPALLWTVPWDGTVSLNYPELDRLYVEICRRVRLVRSRGTIEALAAGSKCARIAAADLKGKTDDPWVPVKADRSSSITPTAAGFGYRALTRLLNEKETVRPLLAQLHEGDDREGLTIAAAALVRGNGKTEGLHRRTVRISRMKQIEGGFGARALDRVGEVAFRRAEDAGEAARILARALSQVIQGGPVSSDVRGDDTSTKDKVKPWRDVFDHQVDDHFFDHDFWAQAEGVIGEHQRSWRTWLARLTRELFERGSKSAPRTEMRRLQAWARALNYLDGRLDKWVEESADDEP